MKIGEFFVELGFMSGEDGKKLNDFVRGIGELDLASIAAVLEVGALYEILRKMTVQAVEAGQAVRNFGIQTGLSTDKMQQWTQFAEQMGASGDDVVSALKAIQMQQARIRTGMGGNAAPFAALGVSVTDEPFKVLDALREKYKNLRPDLQRLINSEFGLSDSMLNVLKASDAQRAALDKNRFLNKDQLEALNDLNRQYIILRQAIYNLSNAIAASVFSRPLKHLIQFVMDVGKALSALKPLLPWVLAFAAYVTAIFAPWVFWLTAIILLIDDFYTYLEGGDSVIGRLIDWVKSLGTWVDWLSQKITDLKMLVEDIGKILQPSFDFKGVGTAGLAAGFAGAAGQITNNNNNNFYFNVAGSGPMGIVSLIESTIRKVLSDAAYSKNQKST